MQDSCLLDEFRYNIRKNLIKKSREDANEIIEDLVEKATDVFKTRLREEIEKNFYYFIDEQIDKICVKSNIDYENPDKSIITIKIDRSKNNNGN